MAFAARDALRWRLGGSLKGEFGAGDWNGSEPVGTRGLDRPVREEEIRA